MALVESEKTAIIAAGLMPQYLWLATGGKSCINDRLNVLKGRKVIAFPDVDGFQEWTDKLAKLSGLDITVSPLLQQAATPEDLAAHIDIADWLIRCHNVTTCHSERSPEGGVEESPAKKSRAFLLAARYLSPENYDAVEALIDDLGLEFWGVERIESTDEEMPP